MRLYNSEIRTEYAKLVALGYTPGEAIARLAFRAGRRFTDVERVVGVKI